MGHATPRVDNEFGITRRSKRDAIRADGYAARSMACLCLARRAFWYRESPDRSSERLLAILRRGSQLPGTNRRWTSPGKRREPRHSGRLRWLQTFQPTTTCRRPYDARAGLVAAVSEADATSRLGYAHDAGMDAVYYADDAPPGRRDCGCRLTCRSGSRRRRIAEAGQLPDRLSVEPSCSRGRGARRL